MYMPVKLHGDISFHILPKVLVSTEFRGMMPQQFISMETGSKQVLAAPGSVITMVANITSTWLQNHGIFGLLFYPKIP